MNSTIEDNKNMKVQNKQTIIVTNMKSQMCSKIFIKSNIAPNSKRFTAHKLGFEEIDLSHNHWQSERISVWQWAKYQKHEKIQRLSCYLKNKQKKNIGNYRPISLLSHMYELLSEIKINGFMSTTRTAQYTTCWKSVKSPRLSKTDMIDEN